MKKINVDHLPADHVTAPSILNLIAQVFSCGARGIEELQITFPPTFKAPASLPPQYGISIVNQGNGKFALKLLSKSSMAHQCETMHNISLLE